MRLSQKKTHPGVRLARCLETLRASLIELLGTGHKSFTIAFAYLLTTQPVGLIDCTAQASFKRGVRAGNESHRLRQVLGFDAQSGLARRQAAGANSLTHVKSFQ